MDTPDTPHTVNETTPLVPAKASKKPKTPLPKFQIGILMFLHVADPIASMSIFPYINQLISELGITGGDDAAVGYYAGIIESLFFFAQALTVLRWSRWSDNIGRKPVLAIGLLGSCVSMLCFGLSKTFWSLVISRCVCGVLNGNIGVLKTAMGELTDSTNMAQGFALIQVFWRIGCIVGPLMGGALAEPQDHWPRLFAGSFWGTYPYFLPCAVAAFVLLLAFFMLFFLEETLSTKRRSKSTSASLGFSSDAEIDREVLAQKSVANMPLRSLLTPTVVIPIANYSMLSFLDIALRALLPLFFSTPTHLGGLGLTPASIGLWLALYGIVDVAIQVLLFPIVVDWLGPKRLFTVAVSCFAPFMLLFPIMSWLVNIRGTVDYTITFALLCQLILIGIWDMAFGTIFVFITSSAPAKNLLGAINGLGQTTSSMARAFGPALATSLFAFSKEYNVLGGNAAYVVLIVLGGVLSWLGLQLPEYGDE
ncbi:MFS general substrate transporter [Rhizopogon vinicolor AM-OR11-026]|uniref:MFS general substrate transporter n=1 Tax=Rhizopogon vinicolor AM-OR11-026 TaxID=1314800 RepID=A0A1B7MZB4_9AGAM|nr:MFS general substrate transporter [Rhizopogon vinicolor AM-OR11-026]